MKKASILLSLVLAAALALAGCGKAAAQPAGSAPAKGYTNPATLEGDIQTITTKFGARSYAPITVQAGVPVRWIIQLDEKDLNGCNNEMQIPEYGITQPLQAGDTVVEFTPTEAGTIPYSCWMGMIRSKIVVVDSLGGEAGSSAPLPASVPPSTAAAASQPAIAQTAAAPAATGEEVTIAVATLENNAASVVIPVEWFGYQPEVVIVPRGVETSFNFDLLEPSCASYVVFPQTGEVTDLTQSPVVTLVPDTDFTVQCSMGMYGMQVMVVDDLASAETQQLIASIQSNPDSYRFQGSGCAMGGQPGGQGGGCCG